MLQQGSELVVYNASAGPACTVATDHGGITDPARRGGNTAALIALGTESSTADASAQAPVGAHALAGTIGYAFLQNTHRAWQRNCRFVRQQQTHYGAAETLLNMPHCTLVLVRHGHVADNDCLPSSRLLGWTDPPLSQAGREQAAQVARYLALKPRPLALYASPLQRAWATAVSIGTTLRLRPRRRAALREIGCGSLDGVPLAEVEARHPTLWRRNLAQNDEDFAWPHGESYREFRQRVVRDVTALARAHPGQRIVAVTHAGVITQLLGALHAENPARWDAYRVANASVTEVRWSSDGVRSGIAGMQT